MIWDGVWCPFSFWTPPWLSIDLISFSKFWLSLMSWQGRCPFPFLDTTPGLQEGMSMVPRVFCFAKSGLVGCPISFGRSPWMAMDLNSSHSVCPEMSGFNGICSFVVWEGRGPISILDAPMVF